MELMYGLTKDQMKEVFRYVRVEYIKDNIMDLLTDCDYSVCGKEFSGETIASCIDLDEVAQNFLDKDEFNWCLLENLIEHEVSLNRDYILTGRRD